MVRDQGAEYVSRCNLSNLDCKMISEQRERRRSVQKMPKSDLIRTSTRLVPQIFDEREVLSTLGPGESPSLHRRPSLRWNGRSHSCGR